MFNLEKSVESREIKLTVGNQGLVSRGYVPISEKKSVSNVIIKQIFGVTYNENEEIESFSNQVDEEMLSIMIPFAVVSTYIKDIDFPLLTSGAIDIQKTTDLILESGLLEKLSEVNGDVRAFLGLIEKDIQSFKEFVKIKREDILMKTLEDLTMLMIAKETVDIERTTIENSQLSKLVEMMPNSIEAMKAESEEVRGELEKLSKKR